MFVAIRPAQTDAMHARILAVDDDERVLRSIQRTLRRYQVQTCLGGREALKALEAQEFDVILCDVMMPDLTGLDVHEWLQAQGKGLERRMIFITGGVPMGSVRASLETMDNQLLYKPFTRQELEQAIEHQFSVDRAGDEQ